jgi:tRNA modification GTPase
MLSDTGTIAAIATPPGGSGRAIVRLSGRDVDGVLRRLTGVGLGARGVGRVVVPVPPRASPDGPEPTELLLPAMLVSMPGPGSYTGEDSAELLVAGNTELVQRLLDVVLEAGARLAGPGEFTARAFLAGRLTIGQAEGVAALIAAERDDELELGRRLLSGEVGERHAGWAARIADLAGLVEAGVDFTDQEDVVPISASALRAGLASIRAEIEAEVGGAGTTEPRSDDPSVVIVGPPSAGKSTLFNALLGWERAVVHESPGTTRDVLVEPLDLSGVSAIGVTVRLADLPGLDPLVSGRVDGSAQRVAWAAIERADLILHCDPTGRFDMPGLPATPTVRVRTKADLGAADKEGAGLAVCALDGWHLGSLRRAIADHAGGALGRGIVPRHRRAFTSAVQFLEEAIDAIGADEGGLREPELVAASIRGALDEVGSVCGRVTPDDVLGRVFAGFCVGK